MRKIFEAVEAAVSGEKMPEGFEMPNSSIVEVRKMIRDAVLARLKNREPIRVFASVAGIPWLYSHILAYLAAPTILKWMKEKGSSPPKL